MNEETAKNEPPEISYDYMPGANGGNYADTVATIDGKKYVVNTQYSVVAPWRHLSDDCEMMTKIGGKCTCGALDGVDVPALITDARINGKLGMRPVPVETLEQKTKRLAGLAELDKHGPGWCDKCKSYCYGDCEA